jgi:protein TonB
VQGELVRPKLVKRFKPKYTYGARVFQSEGVVIVRVVIDDKGGVGYPVVLKKQENPALTFVALEAIRKWKFRPATLDGHPIHVFYNLTVNYKLQR